MGARLLKELLGARGRDKADPLSIIDYRSMFCRWLYIEIEI